MKPRIEFDLFCPENCFVLIDGSYDNSNDPSFSPVKTETGNLACPHGIKIFTHPDTFFVFIRFFLDALPCSEYHYIEKQPFISSEEKIRLFAPICSADKVDEFALPKGSYDIYVCKKHLIKTDTAEQKEKYDVFMNRSTGFA